MRGRGGLEAGEFRVVRDGELDEREEGRPSLCRLVSPSSCKLRGRKERTQAATANTSQLAPSSRLRSTNRQTSNPRTASDPTTPTTSFFVPQNALSSIHTLKSFRSSPSSPSSSTLATLKCASLPLFFGTPTPIPSISSTERSGLSSCTTPKMTSFSASAIACGPAVLISTELMLAGRVREEEESRRAEEGERGRDGDCAREWRACRR